MIIDKYIPVFTPEEEATIEAAYQALVNAYMNSNHRQKIEVIDRAFALARVAHAGVRRRSGEPYILHPIAVAMIVCSEMGLGSTSIVSALLHDVVEDTEYTLDDIRERFGDKVAVIVDGLTKVSGDKFGSGRSVQTESLRKILLSMSDDARVILIKIADRLHNMRTLGSMLPSKQYKIAGETQYIYVPLAHRLGMYTIKTELEDLSFKYEHPDSYRQISQQIADTAEDRERLLQRFAAPIEAALISEGINYDLKMRTKSNYSIWRKMQTKGIPFEEVYDLFAVRIIFETRDGYPENKRCFDIYTVITSLYKSKTERVRDWVSSPKSNGYRALHVTVMGPDGRWIEVQIRSRKMDEIAEHGLAAHWRYKNELVEEDKELGKWLDTVREVVQAPTPNGMDFLDTFKLSLYSDDIIAFTPMGDSLRLPYDATVLDFAYNIHSKLGDSCIGAKINHKAVPITTKLKQGDQVEILHSRTMYPRKEWLNYVVTPKARLGISSALRRKAREQALQGEEVLRGKLGVVGLELSNSVVDRLISFYQYSKREELFQAIALGYVDLERDMAKLVKSSTEVKNTSSDALLAGRVAVGTSANIRSISREFNAIIDPEEHNKYNKIDKKKVYELREEVQLLNYKPARCCRPIPGDEVLGIVTDIDEVVVHKLACPVATKIKSIEGNRLISTRWGEHHDHRFETTLIFRGVDNVGILHGITQTLLEYKHINISGIHITCKDGIFSGRISVMVHNTEEVEEICNLLKMHEAIINVHRLAEETVK